MSKIGEFFKGGINYSACNEDGRSELSLLQKTEARRALVICGAGERVFNLLLAPVANLHVDVLDGNATQLHLFELKRVAILMLDRQSFLAFLGVYDTADQDRSSIYRELIRPNISEDTRTFWDSNIRLIRKGVIYSGQFEKFLKIISTICTLAYGRRLTEFFACQTLSDQSHYFKKHIAGLRWEILMRSLCRKIWFRILSNDPAFYTYDGINSYYRYLRSAMEYSLLQVPARENFLLALMLTGRYLNEYDTVPPCYSSRGYETVKKNLSLCSINTNHGLLGDFIGKTPINYDLMSFSDVSSYMSNMEMESLLNTIGKNLSINGHAVFRQLFSRHEVLKKGQFHQYGLRHITREEELLKSKDSSFIYQFHVLGLAN